MKIVRIVLACESSLFSEGMAALLQREKDLAVVGTIERASQVITALALRPDVIILDLLLFKPEEALKALHELKRKAPRSRILIIYWMQEMTDTTLMQYLMQGVDGYIKGTEKLEHVIEAIRTVHGGSLWAERRLLQQFVRYSPMVAQDLDSKLAGLDTPLTQREREIVAFLFRGLSNKSISSTLNISETTVKSHLQNIFRKMKVSSRTQVISSLVYTR